jgi:ubiquinone/menaquinone biosynthesis C-methylase UbiE
MAAMSGVSANWARGHPWAAVYDFFVEREALSRPAGLLLFGTDTRLLYDHMRALDEVPDGGAVLDIPCGGGVALRAVRPEHSFRYVAADIAPAMLERTAEVARSRGLGPLVETAKEDAEALTFDDGSFDLVMSFAGLHCFPHPDVACREIARVLKPGGRLAVSDIALKRPLPDELAKDVMAYVGCIAGAIAIDDYRRGLIDAGFAGVQVIDSGADLNAYSKVEGQAACCAPPPPASAPAAASSSTRLPIAPTGCCGGPATTDALHENLKDLLSRHDVNDYAASVKIFAAKPR